MHDRRVDDHISTRGIARGVGGGMIVGAYVGGRLQDVTCRWGSRVKDPVHAARLAYAPLGKGLRVNI